jgi:hypothetical protein
MRTQEINNVCIRTNDPGGRHRPAVTCREHGRRLSSADQPGKVFECADGCAPITVSVLDMFPCQHSGRVDAC